MQAVCGTAKLGNMTVSQMLYRVHFMIKEDFDKFQLLNLIAFCKDGQEISFSAFCSDMENFVKISDLPDHSANKFSKCSISRWMTLCTASLALKTRDNLSPTRKFEDTVAAPYGGFDSPAYQAVRLLCPCHSRSGPSQLKLIFLYLANHSPGGITGKGYSNYMQILACMTTTDFRVSIEFTAALLPFYKTCCKFYDGNSSKIFPGTETYSCRVMEVSVFNRRVLTYFESFCDDPHKLFPEYWAYLQEEAKESPAIVELFDKNKITDQVFILHTLITVFNVSSKNNAILCVCKS
jgi:hypothetical protein